MNKLAGNQEARTIPSTTPLLAQLTQKRTAWSLWIATAVMAAMAVAFAPAGRCPTRSGTHVGTHLVEPVMLPRHAGGCLGRVGGELGLRVLPLPVYFLLLLFPDGRLPSARWRDACWHRRRLRALVLLFAAFVPGPIDRDSFPTVPNPLGTPMLSFAARNEGVFSFLCLRVPNRSS